MHILINGARLYFDVKGLGLRADGAVMREVPTLQMLYGGLGADHSIYKLAFSACTEFARVVYLDHCGNGRSDSGPRESWMLAQ